MSKLTVSEINTPSNTDPLFFRTGNTSAGFLKLESANNDIIIEGNFRNFKYDSAWDTANAANGYANTLYVSALQNANNNANSANGYANTLYVSALQNANNNANSANAFAVTIGAAANTWANTKLANSSGTFAGNLGISGNIAVSSTFNASVTVTSTSGGGQMIMQTQQGSLGTLGSTNNIGIEFIVNNVRRAFIDTTGDITFTGNVLPSSSNTKDLGSSTARWRNIFTGDLHLANDHGDWTIVEGEDELFLYNNLKDKVYKFNLTEVDKSTVPPKKGV